MGVTDDILRFAMGVLGLLILPSVVEGITLFSCVLLLLFTFGVYEV